MSAPQNCYRLQPRVIADVDVTPVVDVRDVISHMRFLVARINKRVRNLDEEEIERRRQQPEIQMRIGTVVGVVKPRKRRVPAFNWEQRAEEQKPSWFE